MHQILQFSRDFFHLFYNNSNWLLPLLTLVALVLAIIDTRQKRTMTSSDDDAQPNDEPTAPADGKPANSPSDIR